MDAVPLATTAGLCDESGHDPKCMVCGDKSAGKHYGVMACYGCKGFFRRTIRAEQHYVCRFDQCCNIDKDQRNACRFCRFQRCLFVGMEPEAIRPDRDIIGKQKNPRKRKLLMIKQEEISQNGAANVGEGGGSSSLPSPGGDSTCSQQEDLLLNYLLEVELKNSCYGGPPNNPAFGDPRIAVGCAVGIAHPMAGGPPARLLRRAIKLDMEVTLAMLFENRSLLDEFRGATSANSFVNTFINGYDASNLNGALGSSPLSTDEEEAGAVAWREAARAGLAASAGQLAGAEHIADAMRSHVLQCISWINTLFYMANAPRVEDKVTILKNSFAAFCTFEQATQTVRYAPEESPTVDALCLCNGRILPRNAAAQPYLDTTNLLANNMVARVLDELVFPLRRVRVTEPERAALTALIILEENSRNVHTSTSEALRALKEKIQNALFQHIRERTAGAAGLMADRSGSVARASLRFANILLLLPSVAKVAAVYYENAQLAKMFGRGSLDPLLAEIFLEAAPATGAVSSAAAAAMAAAGVKDGGIFGNFYADEPSTSTSGYGSHGPSSADYYTSKPLTINCEMSYGGGSSGVYGTCSYVSAPNSTSRDSVKMCYDASTQTSPDHIATAVGADAMAPAGVIDFNARAYSDSGRFTQSSDYSICQERQHYASGDSCISVGSLGGDDSRAIGLMDSVGISFDSTMRRDFKSMDVGAVASVAPPSVVATTGSAEASAGADFAGEDDAAQMTTIIAMGLDLADEHSRKSTIKSKLETQDYTITDETLLDAANQPSVAAAQFHRRHPSGVSTASSSCCTVEPISPPHLIGVAAPPPPANVIDTTPSSLLAVYTSGADHTTASAAIGASTSVVNANNNSSTAFGDLLRGISGAVIHNVKTGASSPDTVTIVGYAPPTVGEMCAPSASSNLYVSYSQLHQQMAQQHQNALADSGMIYGSGYGGTGIENGNNGSNGTAIDRYDNTTNSVVQQFFPSEQQTQGQQQQELQYVAHPHHQQQPQEQMYQQFFNAEQLILQQQQSQVSFDFNGAVTARAGAPASYPLSAFKFA